MKKRHLVLPAALLTAFLALSGCKNDANDDDGKTPDPTPPNPPQPTHSAADCNEKTRQSQQKIINEQAVLCDDAKCVFRHEGAAAGNYIAGIMATTSSNLHEPHSQTGGIKWPDTKYCLYVNPDAPDFCFDDNDRRYAEDYARQRMAHKTTTRQITYDYDDNTVTLSD